MLEWIKRQWRGVPRQIENPTTSEGKHGELVQLLDRTDISTDAAVDRMAEILQRTGEH